MKTTSLIFSFVLLASAGFGNCSQLRGGSNDRKVATLININNNKGTELVRDLEDFEDESYIIEDQQRELSPFKIRIKVKNSHGESIKVKAVCRNSKNDIIETDTTSHIVGSGVAEITNNHCAKIEVKFWHLPLLSGWKRMGKDSGSEKVITENSNDERTKLEGYKKNFDNNGFVIEPNPGNSVINQSKFCFKICDLDSSDDNDFLVKYRKNYNDCKEM